LLVWYSVRSMPRHGRMHGVFTTVQTDWFNPPAVNKWGPSAAAATATSSFRPSPSGMVVLIVYICNYQSIGRDLGDPRYDALLAVGRELQRRNHTVFWVPESVYSSSQNGDARCRVGTDAAASAAAGYPPFPILDQRQPQKKIDVAVAWSNVRWSSSAAQLAPTRQAGQEATRLAKAAIPTVQYENGLTRGSIVVDPGGLLGDSHYIKVRPTSAIIRAQPPSPPAPSPFWFSPSLASPTT